MRRFASSPRLIAALALAGSIGLIAGCGGSEEAVVLQFPEGTAPPTLSTSDADTKASGSTSQGDPSQYTK